MLVMKKDPKEMVDIELMEKYSHYNKMGFRLQEDQDYLASLRREIMRRMEVDRMSEHINVKKTSIGSCAECQKDFSKGETCNFTWYENNVFCHDCKIIMNGKVSEGYLDWQLRIYNK